MVVDADFMHLVFLFAYYVMSQWLYYDWKWDYVFVFCIPVIL